MVKNEDVFLTKAELNAFLSKQVGLGTDGRVMRFDKNRLMKLYHKYMDSSSMKDNNDEDVKIYHMGDLNDKKNFIEMFSFYKTEEDNEYIKINSNETAIRIAEERQIKVKNTRLPKNAVYVDGRFAGCILASIKGIQIHKMMGLPFNFKKKIMKKVLHNVKELMDNYIYHIDLDNSPYTTKAIRKEDGVMKLVGHSHVLINPITLKPQLIDLDGKSTVYTDTYSKAFEEKSLISFNKLMIEFLYSINLDEYETEDELRYELSQIGIDIEYIDLLAEYSLNYEQLEEILDDKKSKK